MRGKKEIIKDFNETQAVYDRLINEIGQLYAQHRLTNDQNLVPTINNKVDAFQKVEMQLKTLEQELIEAE
jgi:uncharacterized membrane-anchored protein YhcB (DUF1043 family)